MLCQTNSGTEAPQLVCLCLLPHSRQSYHHYVCINYCYWLYKAWYNCNNKHTVWVKKITPWGFMTFFPKRLGIFSPNFTRLLYASIYARLPMFIRLSATLAKLCYIKRDHPVQISRNTCIQAYAKVVDSFVDRCLWQVIPDLLQCTFSHGRNSRGEGG